MITPAIARLLRRKGTKLVALYGSTAAVHDAVTRTPGSFAALEQGIAYLREAGAAFTVQVVPMRTNYRGLRGHGPPGRVLEPQLESGRDLALPLGLGRRAQEPRYPGRAAGPAPDRRARRGPGRRPGRGRGRGAPACAAASAGPGGLYAACIAGRRDFHVDPYGGMSFCSFVKDPALRFDLRAIELRRGLGGAPAAPGRGRPAVEVLRRRTAGRATSARTASGAPSSLISSTAITRPRSPGSAISPGRRAAPGRNGSGRHRRRYRVAGLSVDVEADLPISDDDVRAQVRPLPVGRRRTGRHRPQPSFLPARPRRPSISAARSSARPPGPSTARTLRGSIS